MAISVKISPAPGVQAVNRFLLADRRQAHSR
jgi:hypothetical protein